MERYVLALRLLRYKLFFRHYVNYVALSLVKLRFSWFRPTPLSSLSYPRQPIGKRLSTVRWLIRIKVLRVDNTFKILSTRICTPHIFQLFETKCREGRGIEQSSFSPFELCNREASGRFGGINWRGSTRRIARSNIYPFARIPPARNRRNSISVTNELLIQMLSNYPWNSRWIPSSN